MASEGQGPLFKESPFSKAPQFPLKSREQQNLSVLVSPSFSFVQSPFLYISLPICDIII